MELVLKIHPGDLSVDTLRAIRDDLAKYAHLKAYKPTYELIISVIEARKTAERKAR